MIANSTDGRIDMDDRTVRLALERHWSASDAGDFDVEHEIEARALARASRRASLNGPRAGLGSCPK